MPKKNTLELPEKKKSWTYEEMVEMDEEVRVLLDKQTDDDKLYIEDIWLESQGALVLERDDSNRIRIKYIKRGDKFDGEFLGERFELLYTILSRKWKYYQWWKAKNNPV